MNYIGILIGAAVFVMIGFFHPIVIKAEYYLGVRCWPCFAVAGTAALVGSLLVENVIISVLLGAFAFSCFWSILSSGNAWRGAGFPRTLKKTNTNDTYL